MFLFFFWPMSKTNLPSTCIFYHLAGAKCVPCNKVCRKTSTKLHFWWTSVHQVVGLQCCIGLPFLWWTVVWKMIIKRCAFAFLQYLILQHLCCLRNIISCLFQVSCLSGHFVCYSLRYIKQEKRLLCWCHGNILMKAFKISLYPAPSVITCTCANSELRYHFNCLCRSETSPVITIYGG